MVQNEIYFEHMRERFAEVECGHTRAAIIDELRQVGRPDLADSLVTEWYQERLEYLTQNNIDPNSVVESEDYPGMELYPDIQEWGTPGDDYQVKEVLRPVPMHLSAAYWLS